MKRDPIQYAKRVGFYTMVIAIMLYAVFPFYYAILSSFKTGQELYNVNYFPFSLDLQNYESVFFNQNFGKSIWNSILVSFGVVALALLLGLTGAFALARVKFRGRGLLLMTILGVSMFPQVAVLSGMFEIISSVEVAGFRLQGSLWSLIFSYMIFTLPFTVWILTTFMRDLPLELEEAAIMDGATPWQTIVYVFMPLMWPALVTTGLLAFIAAWNEFLFALTFLSADEHQRTVPVAIALMGGDSPHELPWGNIMAASVVVTVPVVVLVLVFQRRIISGLTDGAVKG